MTCINIYIYIYSSHYTKEPKNETSPFWMKTGTKEAPTFAAGACIVGGASFILTSHPSTHSFIPSSSIFPPSPAAMAAAGALPLCAPWA